ncbi:hypothetical protein SEVIR_7G026052v4 [Setaria viridis]
MRRQHGPNNLNRVEAAPEGPRRRVARLTGFATTTCVEEDAAAASIAVHATASLWRLWPPSPALRRRRKGGCRDDGECLLRLRRCGAHATVSGAVAAPGCGGDEAVAEALASADVEETYLAEIARKERRLPGRGQVCLC